MLNQKIDKVVLLNRTVGVREIRIACVGLAIMSAVSLLVVNYIGHRKFVNYSGRVRATSFCFKVQAHALTQLEIHNETRSRDFEELLLSLDACSECSVDAADLTSARNDAWGTPIAWVRDSSGKIRELISAGPDTRWETPDDLEYTLPH